MPEARRPSPARSTGPTIGLLLGGFVGAIALAIGLRPLSDNSFLTHLATGRLILADGSVPGRDPYTFTAFGEPWVVQSWLASVLYASAERLGGLDGVRVVMGLQALAVAVLGWRLLRPASGAVARLGVAGLVLTVGAGQWSGRPLMLGLAAFALTVLVTEERLDPRWLIPLGWLWANTHGSFPLGLAYLAVVAVADRFERLPTRASLVALGCLAGGVVLGAVGPLGPQLLLFPIDLVRQQDLLSTVVEWRPPTFDDLSQRAFLVQVVLAIVLLARRPRQRDALVLAVFTAAALLGARNIVVASIALLPGMARGLVGVGSLRWDARPSMARGLVAVIAALASVVTIGRLQQRDLTLERYPVPVLGYLEANGVNTSVQRMAAPDIVGNLQGYIYGPERRVFYDDRFDMFPMPVSEAHLALVYAEPDLFEHLDELEIDLVTVPREAPAGQVLRADPAWRTLFLDEDWSLSCRRGASLGEALGTC
ncbi:MAG: hypothetical protein ACSLFP_13675 [Acidimicrobiales bacterium]